jgi:hypothetical protein
VSAAIAEVRKISRMRKGDLNAHTEFLATGAIYGEEEQWKFNGTPEGRSGVVGRIVSEAVWVGMGDGGVRRAAVYPRLMAADLVRLLAEDKEVFYFTVTVGQGCGAQGPGEPEHRDAARRQRRRRDREAMAEDSVENHMRMAPEEVYAHTERRGLA